MDVNRENDSKPATNIVITRRTLYDKMMVDTIASSAN